MPIAPTSPPSSRNKSANLPLFVKRSTRASLRSGVALAFFVPEPRRHPTTKCERHPTNEGASRVFFRCRTALRAAHGAMGRTGWGSGLRLLEAYAERSAVRTVFRASSVDDPAAARAGERRPRWRDRKEDFYWDIYFVIITGEVVFFDIASGCLFILFVLCVFGVVSRRKAMIELNGG